MSCVTGARKSSGKNLSARYELTAMRNRAEALMTVCCLLLRRVRNQEANRQGVKIFAVAGAASMAQRIRSPPRRHTSSSKLALSAFGSRTATSLSMR